jgi:hypothetical protein
MVSLGGVNIGERIAPARGGIQEAGFKRGDLGGGADHPGFGGTKSRKVTHR